MNVNRNKLLIIDLINFVKKNTQQKNTKKDLNLNLTFYCMLWMAVFYFIFEK